MPSSCSSSIQITQFASWRNTVALRFFASDVAYKDIWVSIGYVQKHVVARAALARDPRISNASVIHPLSNKKWPSHDMCLSKRRRIACHKSCRIHCPFVSMVKPIWTKKAVQLIFGDFFFLKVSAFSKLVLNLFWVVYKVLLLLLVVVLLLLLHRCCCDQYYCFYHESAQASVGVAILAKLRIKLTVQSSHSILTPGQPVQRLTQNTRHLAG